MSSFDEIFLHGKVIWSSPRLRRKLSKGVGSQSDVALQGGTVDSSTSELNPTGYVMGMLQPCYYYSKLRHII